MLWIEANIGTNKSINFLRKFMDLSVGYLLLSRKIYRKFIENSVGDVIEDLPICYPKKVLDVRSGFVTERIQLSAFMNFL